ncbi:hypothetical protein HJG60_004396 [Phyllostomus discolor]|uniref:ELM2 and SANT domain-containing protein 1 n=1 Tax=Phyllostomus discolor TaxID=89673 RepID=A0A834BKS1_9CHIR|nr:hypothetical protein HJG60_004396 [Phyllostomus discolor]
MNLQAQPKGQNKRKRCLFGDQEAAPKEQPPPLQAPQQPPGPPQSTRVKEEPYFGHEGPTGAAPASQPVELPNSLALLNSVVYGSERTPATMLPQQVGSKWPNSVMTPGRVPEHGAAGGASDSGWQQQPGQPPPHPAWNCHSLPFYGGHKGSPHPGMGVSPYYNHPEALKREKGGGLPLDRYENAVRPMMPQKVQLEVGRPQAPLNSYHVAKKPPNQTLPLQPFQLAFGHQVNRQVFRQGPPPPNPVAAFPPQKQPQPQQQQGALPQKAVELASLQNAKEANGSEEKRKSVLASTTKCGVEFSEPSLAAKRAREDSGMVPLIIPVSVPVRTVDPAEAAQAGGADEDGKGLEQNPAEHKPSVIVTRRRSTRIPGTDAPAQAEDMNVKLEGEPSVRKPKQRPRPEPLIIPTKAGTFIAPPVYSNITPYQSHLRSPVRLADHPSERSFELPPYTPPPILSPVREGSGLYFNAIMSTSSIPAPPPITPKSAHRTLLRSNSAEVTPPVLSVMGEATPVSIEPRINVGSRFQAEIPPLRDRALAAADPHKADLVWQPWENLESSHEKQRQVEDLLTAACSSIFPGAGTNQELALHCLHESRGDILETLNKLLLKKPLRPHNHPLATYHYTGSDQWKMSERKLFNKGIAIYKKDFFLVQKLIQTKTVAQCVEFYYTYKKQVKIGRNGTLTFGDVDTSDDKASQEEVEVDIKTSQKFPRVPAPRRESPSEERLEPKREVKETRKEGEEEVPETQEKGEQEEGRERSRRAAAVKATQTLQANESANDVLILRSHESNAPGSAGGQASEKPREGPGKSRRALPFTEKKKKPETFNKTQNQENTFPCKKCGRVFYKVKSRSAHMKSHAEQEKKAAALRQREKEAAAAAAMAAASPHQPALREESTGERG